MIAWISPAPISSVSPLRIWVPPTVAWRLAIFSIGFPVGRGAALGPRVEMVGIGIAVRAGLVLLVVDAHAHPRGHPARHLVHVFEDVGGLDAHHAHADRIEALVAAASNGRVLALLVDGDRHAELRAMEIDNGRADHG